MRLEARGELLSPPSDVWRLVGEPYHLPDWWPGYQGIQPDRRGLAEGARWSVNRGATGSGTSNLLTRPGGGGTIVLTRVVEGSFLAWHDVELRVDCAVALEPAAQRRTTATVSVEGPWARITLEGLRPVPREALRRLHDLCQTAAEL
jgi:hypothetical protein